MKKSLQATLVLALLMFATAAFGQVVNTDHAGAGPYATIQLAINNAATVNGDHLTVAAGTYTEAVTVSKSLTITGVGPTTVVTPPSGIGITVAANSVTLASLKVSGSTGSGIYASGVSDLTLTNVESDNNGSGIVGSGVDVKGITGTSVFTNLTANANHNHGLAIGNGSTGVTVSGGTFSGNGQSGNQSTGGGITVYADNLATTSGTTINGSLNSNTNTTAGIYIYCAAGGTISNTTVGSSGSVVLNDNGNATSGGAAVIVYGAASNTQITASSTRSVVFQTAGLVVVGTDALGNNSPTGTVVKNSTLTGFASTSPAGTMKIANGTDTLICVNDVDATLGNLINGVATGFAVEDLLVHKLDVVALGRFLAPGHTVFVTPNSGSIQRGVSAADATYDTVQVQDGTYAENVLVNKALVLIGQGANTIIHPASGAPVDASIAGVTFEKFNLYLNAAFAPSNTPTFTTNTFTFRTQAKVFLQGPYSAGSMTTTLNTGALIPLSQPYNVAPFSYAGTETVASVPANVTDWILVELRSGTTGATKTSIRACFLKNDGTVLETDGTTGVWESVAVASGFDVTSYVVIRHRNHLAAMSAAGVGMPNASAYDFTSAEAQSFGTTPTVDVSGTLTVYALWAGDVTGNGQIKYAGSGNDRGPILTRVGGVNFTATVNGYYPEDCNMNGQVKYAGSGNDRGIILTNIGGASFTATRSTAVPN